MANLQQALTSAVRTGFCQALPGVVTGALLFSALSATTGVGLASGLAVAGGAAAVYGLGCNRPLPDDAFPTPPFTGGQCGILYSIGVRCRYSGTFVPSGTLVNVQAYGQVRGVRFQAAPGNSALIYIQGGNPIGSSSGEQLAGSTVLSFSPSDVLQSVSIETITPVNPSQPDNCGNPPIIPPVIPNPGDNVITPDITYTNDDGIDVTIPVVLAFGYANVDINGELIIPVAVNLDLNPEVNFVGNFNLRTGDFNINLGDPDSPFGRGGDCGGDTIPDGDTPDPNLPLPPSDPIAPSNPDRPTKRKILRGCIVTTTVLNGKQTELDQGNNPDIYIPAIGYVNFLVQVGGITAWTQDIPVKNVRQIIECPWVSGAIDVRGTPSYNNQFTVKPIYTQQTFPAQFPPES